MLGVPCLHTVEYMKNIRKLLILCDIIKWSTDKFGVPISILSILLNSLSLNNLCCVTTLITAADETTGMLA